MKIDFDKSDGLVPCIIQDAKTNTVLMLGYMNAEAFEKTETEKRVTFYSRSKKRLWTKGEESGNFLNVVSIHSDCDNDTLLIKANPDGPVCHTGSDTCFNERNQTSTITFLAELEATIIERLKGDKSESYVARLFGQGINKIAQKVGEEAVELVIEAKDNNRELFLNEAADLLFHYLLLLRAKDSSLTDVAEILRKRKK